MDIKEFLILIGISFIMYLVLSSLPDFYWQRAVNSLRQTPLLDRRSRRDRRSFRDRRQFNRGVFDRRIHHRRDFN